MTTRPPMALIGLLAGFSRGDSQMSRNIESRLVRLETTRKPQGGALPCVITLPRDATPDEEAAIRAEVARREAAGQHVLLLTLSDDPIAALVDACGP